VNDAINNRALAVCKQRITRVFETYAAVLRKTTEQHKTEKAVKKEIEEIKRKFEETKARSQIELFL
jgi:hypothetical protein